MTNDDRRNEQDQREQHSLPGTNQAGKGASQGDTGGREAPPADATPQPSQEELLQHSLPGTNQAGKGASAGDTGRTGAPRPMPVREL